MYGWDSLKKEIKNQNNKVICPVNGCEKKVDKMTLDYFNRVQRNINVDDIKPEEKARIWFDKLLANEIDMKTFKTGIDFLLPKRQKGDDIGYV